MPGGVSASSVDGALHLLRSPDLELVVDGYNVAMLAWPALELADRRERCIDAVEDIIRRYGTRALVVFDGADVSVAVNARRLARVRFSPPGVIADDVIREVVAGLPNEQPVAVATNDKEVVASVRAMGANTITSETLLAAAGRLR
jgi:predicted RNA-binding protein with PIN domain